MNKRILVTYRSVTGFTKQYAKWIAEELNCALMEWSDVSAKIMSGYDTVIFGGRFHAGSVDGLKKAKKIFAESAAAELIVFATGAAPQTAKEVIEDMWKNNLTPEESESLPHFYMQSGLCYEKMPFGDKLMMKVFASMVRRKKEKSEYETAMAQALGRSYDLSSKEYIRPLISYAVRGEKIK